MPDYYQTFFRNYDQALGRFVAIDPLAEAAESLTGYQYSGNNPVMFNDPLGDASRPSLDSFAEPVSNEGFLTLLSGGSGRGGGKVQAGIQYNYMTRAADDARREALESRAANGDQAARAELVKTYGSAQYVWNPLGGPEVYRETKKDASGKDHTYVYYLGAWKDNPKARSDGSSLEQSSYFDKFSFNFGLTASLAESFAGKSRLGNF